MKTVIVDDEPFGRSQVRFQLEIFFPELIIAAEADNSNEAYDSIIRHQPDLVFLDIELKDGNGFDILERFKTLNFEVIFITAHGHYALKAIKFSALDYLVKPVNKTEFKEAVSKYLEKRKFQYDRKSIFSNLKNNLNADSPDLYRLAVSENGRTLFLKPAEIVRCEADGNYTRIFTKARDYLLSSKTLKEYDDILTEYDFIRIHRSHLVNKRFVKSMGANHELVLEDNTQVEVSRRKLPEIRAILFK